MASPNVLQGIRQAVAHISKMNTFFKILDKVEIISAENGRLTAELTISEAHANLTGSLAGSMAMTLGDSMPVFTLGTLGLDKAFNAVSINMNISYMAPAYVGETIVIETSISKTGKKMTYIQFEMFEKKSKKLICNGQHILFNGQNGFNSVPKSDSDILKLLKSLTC